MYRVLPLGYFLFGRLRARVPDKKYLNRLTQSLWTVLQEVLSMDPGFPLIFFFFFEWCPDSSGWSPRNEMKFHTTGNQKQNLLLQIGSLWVGNKWLGGEGMAEDVAERLWLWPFCMCDARMQTEMKSEAGISIRDWGKLEPQLVVSPGAGSTSGWWERRSTGTSSCRSRQWRWSG